MTTTRIFILTSSYENAKYIATISGLKESDFSCIMYSHQIRNNSCELWLFFDYLSHPNYIPIIDKAIELGVNVVNKNN